MRARPARIAGVQRRPLSPQAIGRAATLALYDELALSPKPGLVTLTDSGSHADMDARTFMRSLFSLRSYFVKIAALGAAGAPFEHLERCGIEAEARMLAATGGVNTHRGAIFTLGLICAAAGSLAAGGEPMAVPHDSPCDTLRANGTRDAMSAESIRDSLLLRWGEALGARAHRASTLPGGIAARRYGLRSASSEAALGFPVLFGTALPALRAALRQGLSPQQARVDTLFHVIAVLDDSNLAHRGGLPGLRHAQQSAARFLAAGGAARAGGIDAAFAIGRDFVGRRLSPGGAADTLAAACLLARLEALAAH